MKKSYPFYCEPEYYNSCPEAVGSVPAKHGWPH